MMSRPVDRNRCLQRATPFLAALLIAIAISRPSSDAAEPVAKAPSHDIAAYPTIVAGRTLDGWKQDLDSSNEIVQLRAARSLAAFGPPAVPELASALDHRSSGVRYWAAYGLGDVGFDPADKQIAGKLRSMLDDKSLGVRMSAAYALCKAGQLDAGLPVLIEATKHPERGITCSAADFLGRIGPPAKGAIPALERLTRSAEKNAAVAAASALKKIRGEEMP